MQANDGGSLNALNKVLSNLKIPLEITKKKGSSGLERPGMTGSVAFAVVAAAQQLLDAVKWTADDASELKDALAWKEKNLRLWTQWQWIVDALSVINYYELTEEQILDFGKHCRRSPSPPF